MKSSINWKTLVLNIIITCILITGMFFLGKSFFKDKLAYIKTGYIINEYKGMIVANEQFNSEMTQVKANLDTLRLRYEKLAGMEKMVAAKEREDWAYRTGMARAEYEKYSQQASEQMEKRKTELTGNVLQEINQFVQDFGKQKGYRFVFGTTENGSILYAEDADDLTNTVLGSLNEKYKNLQPEGAVNKKQGQ